MIILHKDTHLLLQPCIHTDSIMKCEEALISAHAACPCPDWTRKRQREMCRKTQSLIYMKLPLVPSLLRTWPPVCLSHCLVVQLYNCHYLICNYRRAHSTTGHTEDEQNTFYIIPNIPLTPNTKLNP
jgi:hypothetical protein